VTPLDLDLPLSVSPNMVSPTRRIIEAKLGPALDDEDALQKIRSHYPDVPIHFTDDTDHIRQRAATVGAVPPLVSPLQLDFGTPSTSPEVDRAEDAAPRPAVPG